MNAIYEFELKKRSYINIVELTQANALQRLRSKYVDCSNNNSRVTTASSIFNSQQFCSL